MSHLNQKKDPRFVFVTQHSTACYSNCMCDRRIRLTYRFFDQEMNPSVPSRTYLRVALVAVAVFVSATCTPNRTEPPRSTENRVLTAPSGASVAVEAEDGQWTMPAKNYASTRFSGLEEINTQNVANLKLAWSFSTGVL